MSASLFLLNSCRHWLALFLQKGKWDYSKVSKAWWSQQQGRFGQPHNLLIQSFPALVADTTQEWQGLVVLSSAPHSPKTWSPGHGAPEISQSIPCSWQGFFFWDPLRCLKTHLWPSLVHIRRPLCGKCFVVLLFVFICRGLTLPSFPSGSPGIKRLLGDRGIPRGNLGPSKSVGFPYGTNCGTHSHHVSDLQNYLFYREGADGECLFSKDTPFLAFLAACYGLASLSSASIVTFTEAMFKFTLINATWPLFTRDSLAPQYHKWFYEQHMDKC